MTALCGVDGCPVVPIVNRPFCLPHWLALPYNTRLRLLDYGNHSADGYLAVLTQALRELVAA